MVWFGGLLYGIGAIQCSMVQGSIVWWGACLYGMVWCSKAQYGAVQCSMVLYGAGESVGGSGEY